MRFLSPLAVLLLSTAAFADTLTAPSTITAVTVYADAAQVTRTVTLDLPAGRHSLTVTDLPWATAPLGVQLTAPEGVATGALSLRAGRLTPADAPKTAAQQAAETALDTARAALVQAQADRDGAQALVDAALARADFLNRVTADVGPDIGPAQVVAMADTIATETLAAKRAAADAGAALPAADRAVTDAQDAVTAAEEALSAVTPDATEGQQLTVALDVTKAGPTTLTLTHLVEGAYWRPAYGLTLARGDVPALTLDRGAFVTQDTGEDWRGVDLTLSTAQLNQQMTPSEPWPKLRRIGPPDAPEARTFADDAAMPEAVMAAPMMAEATASDDLVLYHFPAAVDVATGVEDLRIALDRISLAPEVEARAIPAIDQTAFQVARFTNPTDEILLPGQALLTRDGAVIGTTDLDRLAPGQETEVGFGPIEGLRLTAIQPTRAEGDSGIIVKSNRQETTVVYTVENLTTRDWTVRLLDTVSYSEQDDLTVDVTADPAPTETDVDDQRGLWAWSLPVPAGETAKVTVTESLGWPSDMVLQP
ncbi:MAG: hypothetical protein CFE34_07075 [Rhodobacteraceae bacterium PARR1]|nr:MAG: hypothetical protein CFE34_07075 [Rhodobacteraceae bacterium PARR1]